MRPPTPDLITVADVAAMTHWSEVYVRRLAKVGRIPGAVRWGGRWGFHEETVRRWIAAGLPKIVDPKLFDDPPA